ncbi:interleukin-6 receptor subunit beta [Anolis carolinensis]|uniref:Interleukin-6 receptor subunit beta n=1 Tax=Anolis carolinensis TaxID=28377 RepID=G1KQG1_ANOCA|nr:PREDICTED: interleukin-6 receptor subunit beta [Anolis carolinensis]|eukprot:XP_008100987.1 PREDICTED: interleukin-6 receptor subunit beta [Anolis carolinensis]
MFSKRRWLVQVVYTLLFTTFGDSLVQMCGHIYPESPVILPIGSSFTAFCVLYDTCPYYDKVHANQIFWKTKNVIVPKEQYHIINQTVSSITFNDTSTLISPLTCNILVEGNIEQNIYGIQIQLGYPPEKPENVSCIVIQLEKKKIVKRCTWEPGRNTYLKTNYTLKSAWSNTNFPDCIPEDVNNSCTSFDDVTFFVRLYVWVEAKNYLGEVNSSHIAFFPEDYVKPLPPRNLFLNSREFPTVLRLSWENQFNEPPLKLKYKIRYRSADSTNWAEVPPEDTESERTSFTIQDLHPFTKYIFQISCAVSGMSRYWSDWSKEVIGFTAEDKPSKGPAVWRKITTHSSESWTLELNWKMNPSEVNGIILMYEVTVSRRPPFSLPIEVTHLNTTETKLILNVKNGMYEAKVTAYNKAGKSPTTVLLIPATNSKAPVKNIIAFPKDDKLWVNWTAPKDPVIKYIIEWYEECDSLNCSTDWQQEPGTKQGTFLKGDIKPFKCYKITVYPLYANGQGEERSTQTYLQQDVPANGPTVRTKKVGKSEVLLEWKPLSFEEQNGFIKFYTISYKTVTGNETVVRVNSSESEYPLSALSKDTLYIVQMAAYTEKGGKSGPAFTFTTKKFANGEIEAIVVPVCLAVLLSILLGVLFCFSKRDFIKKHIWPNVPDPSKSVIAQWSPQTPSKHFNSKEHIYPEGSFTDVSVVEIDADDKKSFSETDLKPFDMLKKEKNASEGHSSGIGGSSCMSSPRQSVSDSDEGEPAQNTSSTVQYSTVVPNGYRDQIPAVQVFPRSESTQPLLDSEERPEDQQVLGSDSSTPRRHYFKQNGNWNDVAAEGSNLEKLTQISPINEEDAAGLQASQTWHSGPETDEQGAALAGVFRPSPEGPTVQLEAMGANTGTDDEVSKSYLPQTVRQGGYMPQ